MSTSKILMGAIYSHLAKTIIETPGLGWTVEQLGGKIMPARQCPYIIFGNYESRPWRSVTFDGEHHRLSLDIHFGTSGKGKAREYSSIIRDILHGADFAMKGHTLIEMQHNETQYIEQADQESLKARLSFTALTVSD